MNMPNLASCHQAIRCARVAAILAAMGEGGADDADWAAGAARTAGADAATAPAAPRPFRNVRRELADQSMAMSPCGGIEREQICDRRAEENYISAPARGGAGRGR